MMGQTGHNNTVFPRSNAVATIYFITRNTVATIRGRPLIKGGIIKFSSIKQGSVEMDWSTMYEQRRFFSALGRAVPS